MKTPYFVHPGALVETDKIGAGSRIWAFVHVLPGAVIGDNCNICDHCFIENKVTIGHNTTVKCGVYLWDGITVEDDVFIGPNVVFTNDLRPRSKQAFHEALTLIKQGASLGANSTVLAGVSIGRFAMSGIGAVITRDVPDHALVYGNPAKVKGWVDEEGNKLSASSQQKAEWISEAGVVYVETPSGLKRK